MADYPNEIFEQREIENKPDVVYDPAKKTTLFVEDLQDLGNEIIAIEEKLGIPTEEQTGTVFSYLAYILEQIELIWLALGGAPADYLSPDGIDIFVDGSGNNIIIGE